MILHVQVNQPFCFARDQHGTTVAPCVVLSPIQCILSWCGAGGTLWMIAQGFAFQPYLPSPFDIPTVWRLESLIHPRKEKSKSKISQVLISGRKPWNTDTLKVLNTLFRFSPNGLPYEDVHKFPTSTIPFGRRVWILAATMISLFLWIVLSEQNIITLLFHYWSPIAIKGAWPSGFPTLLHDSKRFKTRPNRRFCNLWCREKGTKEVLLFLQG